MNNQSIIKEFIFLVLKEGTSCSNIQISDIEFGATPFENGHGSIVDEYDSFTTSDSMGRTSNKNSKTSSTKHNKKNIKPKQSWKLAARDFSGAKSVS